MILEGDSRSIKGPPGRPYVHVPHAATDDGPSHEEERLSGGGAPDTTAAGGELYAMAAAETGRGLKRRDLFQICK